MNMRDRLAQTGLVVWLAFAGANLAVCAQGIPTAEEIAVAIRQLGAKSGVERKAARDFLLAHAGVARNALAEAAKTSDPEVRLTAAEILRLRFPAPANVGSPEPPDLDATEEKRFRETLAKWGAAGPEGWEQIDALLHSGTPYIGDLAKMLRDQYWPQWLIVARTPRATVLLERYLLLSAKQIYSPDYAAYHLLKGTLAQTIKKHEKELTDGTVSRQDAMALLCLYDAAERREDQLRMIPLACGSDREDQDWERWSRGFYSEGGPFPKRSPDHFLRDGQKEEPHAIWLAWELDYRLRQRDWVQADLLSRYAFSRGTRGGSIDWENMLWVLAINSRTDWVAGLAQADPRSDPRWRLAHAEISGLTAEASRIVAGLATSLNQSPGRLKRPGGKEPTSPAGRARYWADRFLAAHGQIALPRPQWQSPPTWPTTPKEWREELAPALARADALSRWQGIVFRQMDVRLGILDGVLGASRTPEIAELVSGVLGRFAQEDSATAWYLLAEIHRRYECFAEAEKAYRSFLAVRPTHVATRVYLSHVLACQGKEADAAAQLAFARLLPLGKAAWRREGVVAALADLGRDEEVVEECALGNRLRGRASFGRVCARHLAEQEKYEEAARLGRCAQLLGGRGYLFHYTSYAEVMAGVAQVFRWRARAALAAGRLEEAVQEMDRAGRAYALEPFGITEDLALLAEAGEREGRERMLAYHLQRLRTNLAAIPGSPLCHRRLAWFLAATGTDPGEAIVLAKRALELKGKEDADCFDVLAEAHSRLGNHAEAIAAAGKALSLPPPSGRPQRWRASGWGIDHFHLPTARDRRIARLRRLRAAR